MDTVSVCPCILEVEGTRLSLSGFLSGYDKGLEGTR